MTKDNAMSDEQPMKRPLSEIGHLFLSSVRDRHMGGMARPQRTPPGQPQQQPIIPGGGAPQPAPQSAPPSAAAPRRASIDLTPDEYARVFGSDSIDSPETTETTQHAPAAAAFPDAPAPVPPVIALIASHLNQDRGGFDRVKRYARHLAARIGRVGLIEMDASAFRLMCFEPMPADGATDAIADDPSGTFPHDFDPRVMAEAIEEMNWDVQRWLLLVTDPRTPEARALLRQASRWVLLTTCDHDGIVASYRAIKSLSDGPRPRLSVALIDSQDPVARAHVYQKLSGVCEQFLQWPIEPEPAIVPAAASEHLVLFCHPARDKAQLASAPQWALVSDLLTRARQDEEMTPVENDAAPAAEPQEAQVRADSVGSMHVGDVIVPSPAAPVEAPQPKEMPIVTEERPVVTAAPLSPVAPVATAPQPETLVQPTAPMSIVAPSSLATEVLDLPNADGSPDAIVSAVLHQHGADLVECPVRAPMCGGARLAVDRNRAVVLLAVARQGLVELKAIGQAYRWLSENLTLIGMAVPQFAIDATRAPRLRLLVDLADLSADTLRPLLQSDHVSIQPYRTLRWGGKTGLLLEAA